MTATPSSNFTELPSIADVLTVWSAFTNASSDQSAPPPEVDSHHTSSKDLIADLEKRDPYESVMLTRMEKGTPITLGGEDYPYKHFERILFGRDIEERQCLDALGLTSDHLDNTDARSLLPDYKRYINNRLYAMFQETIVEHKAHYILSPFTGASLRSVESYLFMHLGLIVVFYRFEEQGKVFFLVSTSAHGERIALIFPQVSKVVMAKPTGHGWHEPSHLMADFKRHIAANADAVKRRMNWAAQREMAPICAVACNASIGHYYWNNISGIQRLLDAGRFEKLDHLLVGPINFMEFSRAYSDLPADRYEVIHSMEELVARSYERDFLYFYNTDRCAREAQANRYISLTADVLGEEKSQKIKTSLPKDALRIWVTLRHGRRCWINQNEGIAQISRQLLADYGRQIIIFDGFTLPSPTLKVQKSDDPAWRGLETIIANEKALANEIAALLPEEVEVRNCIGVTPEEKIATLEQCDFFIAPFGSGAIWTSWISNKPGVYHINTNADEGFKEIVNYRENPMHNNYVPAEFIENAEDSPKIHISYYMDWKGVYQEIQALLSRHGIR